MKDVKLFFVIFSSVLLAIVCGYAVYEMRLRFLASQAVAEVGKVVQSADDRATISQGVFTKDEADPLTFEAIQAAANVIDAQKIQVHRYKAVPANEKNVVRLLIEDKRNKLWALRFSVSRKDSQSNWKILDVSMDGKPRKT